MTETNKSNKHNILNNPIWPEANQLAGYLQAWLRIWTWDYQEQVQLAAWAGLEPGDSTLQVKRSNRSATLPPYVSMKSMRMDREGGGRGMEWDHGQIREIDRRMNFHQNSLTKVN